MRLILLLPLLAGCCCPPQMNCRCPLGHVVYDVHTGQPFNISCWSVYRPDKNGEWTVLLKTEVDR